MIILLLTALACDPNACTDTLTVTVLSSGAAQLDTYQISILDESRTVIADATCGDSTLADELINASCLDDGRVELYVPSSPSYDIYAGELSTDSESFSGNVEMDWVPNADAPCDSAAIELQLESCGSCSG